MVHTVSTVLIWMVMAQLIVSCQPPKPVILFGIKILLLKLSIFQAVVQINTHCPKTTPTLSIQIRPLSFLYPNPAKSHSRFLILRVSRWRRLYPADYVQDHIHMTGLLKNFPAGYICIVYRQEISLRQKRWY